MDQTVRLVFLGEAGNALRATDTVTAGTRRLSAAQKEQAATSRVVTAEAGRASQGMRTFEQDIGKTSRGALAGSGIFRGLGRSVAFASASFLGGYGLLAVVMSSVKVLKEASTNAALTEARIKATGGAAGVTARQIDVLATATARKTAADVEQVHAAANTLLTFREVRNEAGKGNDIYTRAIGLTADLARGMGGDLSTAALQLGRALNDPVKGLTTLSRAGIQFTADQRTQIKALTESGDILKAQKIILDNVAASVGGLAAAYAKTPAGRLDAFRGDIRLLEKDIATALLPDMLKLVKAADDWVKRLEQNKGAQASFRHDIEGIAHGVGDVAGVLHDAVNAVGGFQNAVELLIGFKVARWAIEAAAGVAGLIGKITALGAAATATAAETTAAATVVEGDIAAVGTAATVATGEVGSLRLGLLAMAGPQVLVGLAALLAALLAIDEITHHTKGHTQTGGSAKLNTEVFEQGGKWYERVTVGRNVVTKEVTAAQAKKLLAGPAPAKNQGPTIQAKEAYPLASRGAIIGKPGAGTHSYTEGAGVGGFQWQDDQAVDITMKPGEAVIAAEAGIIGNDLNYGGDSGRFSGWGFQLLADSGNNYFYKHLRSMSVGEGDRVTQGQVLGHGTTTGHLHFAKQGAGTAAAVLSGAGGTAPPRRPPRGGGSGASQLQQLELGLASAGVTKGTADDRAALQALVAYYRKQLANKNLPITTRISDLNIEGGYISQLDALAPKAPSHASAAALVNIHHTLDAVSKLVDQAGLDKRFDPALTKINAELSSKFVSSATLAKIRNQLSDITKAVNAELTKAKKAAADNKAAFAKTWGDLAADAMTAFDKETAAHVGPSRSLLNSLIGTHDKAAIDQAVLDAKKALDDALAGVNSNTDSQILTSVRDMIGKAALANAIDKAQSSILGISPQSVDSGGLIAQLQQLLVPGAGGVDPQAVKDAQRQYDEALYQQKIFDLGRVADAEDAAYTTARDALRSALENQLADWEAYYLKIGEDASKAASDFAKIWAGVLSQFPGWAGGTGTTGVITTPTPPPGNNWTAPELAAVVAGRLPGQVQGFAYGGEGVVAKPTLFLAGEAGAEHYKFTPLHSGMSSSTGDVPHVTVVLDGDLAALGDFVKVKSVQASSQIGRQIGSSANRRRREGV